MKSDRTDSRPSAATDIFTTLRTEILDGHYAPSAKFPSEQQLMRRFGFARTTVRLALDRLKASGMLETRNGSGTYLSALACRASGKLGLVSPFIAGGELTPPIATELARAAATEGYSFLFGNASFPNEDDRAHRYLSLAWDYVAQGVAGVFIEPIERVRDAEAVTRRVIDFCDRHSIAVVLLDRDIVPPPQRSAYDLVSLDNVQIGYRLAAHLVATGARLVCLLAQPDSAPTVTLRFQGAREACLDAGLNLSDVCVCHADPTDADALAALLRRAPTPDAFLCANDITAVALMDTLKQLGKRIPHDVRVTGVDDIGLAARAQPPLTTVRQPYREIAQTAFAAMLQRLRNPQTPPRQILLDAPLVIRKSTARKTPKFQFG